MRRPQPLGTPAEQRSAFDHFAAALLRRETAYAVFSRGVHLGVEVCVCSLHRADGSGIKPLVKLGHFTPCSAPLSYSESLLKSSVRRAGVRILKPSEVA